MASEKHNDTTNYEITSATSVSGEKRADLKVSTWSLIKKGNDRRQNLSR
jgi:hypothetical protein